VFCELVKGLGESLVSGTVPGSSLAFKARKDNLAAAELLSYASKSEAMFVDESLIFRCGAGPGRGRACGAAAAAARQAAAHLRRVLRVHCEGRRAGAQL
jgi:hypothetical protein